MYVMSEWILCYETGLHARLGVLGLGWDCLMDY